MLLAAAITWSGRPAEADPIFIDGRPDVGEHSWCLASNFTSDQVAADAMLNLENWTVVVTTHKPDCGLHTDVRWENGSIPGYFGQTWCRAYWDDGRCDRWDIIIDQSEINTQSHPANGRRHTFCHELGHTVGVHHYFSTPPGDDSRHSCLRSGPAGPDAAWHRRYGGHHRFDHINPWFS